jgi:hypothetical protein
LIFNQSVFTFPVIGVSFSFSLFLYSVLINSCSSKYALNPAGFLCIVLSLSLL